MKCYGLATRFNTAPFQWHIPGNRFNAFFVNQLAQTHIKEVSSFCDSDVQPGEVHHLHKDAYFFSILKVGTNCCIVAADRELTKQEMAYLSMHLLQTQIPMQIVASNIEQYTKNVKIEELKAQIEETKTVMTKNFELLFIREERLQDMLDKTEQLRKSAREFNHEAQKLNSCWPSCTLL